jgi:hypothetical protein
MQYAFEYLTNEAYSLLSRLNQVKPFSMTMPMVKSASVSDKALSEIIALLETEKAKLRTGIQHFIKKISDHKNEAGSERALQTGFTTLKLRFNNILDQLDIFADVLSQRAEHDTGIWLSGLDVLAEDGLKTIRSFTEIPSLMVYLDRGHGAAIRRARTRLPGGGENPVAIIQVPRERMVGSGIASSLIHEVGHQVAALLGLVASLKSEISKKEQEGNNIVAWQYFNRCISEIICDVWATGHLGISATLGLMGVVTLPRYFQFRIDFNDPHPAPYIRVMLSYSFGKKLFPHPQWNRLWDMWKQFYPTTGLDAATLNILGAIEKGIDPFVEMLINHSSKEMNGKKLWQLFPLKERTPEKLLNVYRLWRAKKVSLAEMPPTMMLAMLGQAKYDLAIDSSQESKVLATQLRRWAFNRN